MKKNLYLTLYYFLSIMFLEITFKLLIFKKFFGVGLINIILFSLILSIIFTIISKMFKSEKINNIFIFSILSILGFWFSLEFVFRQIFEVFFSIHLFELADQAASFVGKTVIEILKNSYGIILMFIPLILGIILRKRLNNNQMSLKKLIIMFVILIITSVSFIYSLRINKSKVYSSYNLFYKVDDNSLNMDKMGVMISTYLDVKRAILGFEEVVSTGGNSNIIPGNNSEPTEIVYDYNNLDIDFDSLINGTNNSTLKNIYTYFKNDTGTKQNEYTGYFKDKNLILLMGESFNEIGVREDLTPTLYKLVNNGFVFNNFYTPVMLSTIGGEYQILTSNIPNLSGLNTYWRKGSNSFPMGIGYLFKNAGYSTHAYHNNSYTFQNRNKYLKSIGLDNFMGCYNGLEKLMNCKLWPQSDIEMIKATADKFINQDKFFTYYVTVSGHMSYTLGGNAMYRKNKESVKDLPYSEEVKGYLATQVELDKALELLISKLESAGKLKETVIALVGDHYPYDLSLEEVNEAASYKKDGVIEINRSNFILWNSDMENVNVDKIGSSIDALPTIFNLFGLPYDSRLFIGKDILSTEGGLAIFNNRSWISDYGKYYASNNKFEATTNKEIPENYVSTINSIVSNKITMSTNILKQDIYRKIFK